MITGSATIQTAEFATAAKWAARFLSARPAVPIQGGLMLTLSGGELSIVGFNESATAQAIMAVEGDGDGQVVVSGRLLGELAGTFTGKTVEIGGDGDTLTIAAGRSRVTLPLMDGGQFPSPPAPPEVIGTVSGEALATAVRRAAAARSVSDKQAAGLHCLHLAFGSGAIVVTATDTLRAARAETAFGGQGGVALLDAQTMLDVAESLIGPDAVTIALNETAAGFATPTRAVIMRQTKDDFMADLVGALFVKAAAQPDRARIRVADLTGPVKQAVLVQEREQPVRLTFAPGVVTIAGASKELKQGSDGEIAADYDGPACSFLINPKYLGLATASAPAHDTVELTFDAARTLAGSPSPVLLTSEADPTWRHAIMPIRPPKN